MEVPVRTMELHLSVISGAVVLVIEDGRAVVCTSAEGTREVVKMDVDRVLTIQSSLEFKLVEIKRWLAAV